MKKWRDKYGSTQVPGERPQVFKIDINGVTYTLTLPSTTNAVCAIEEATGRSMELIVRRIAAGNTTDARLFFWAMLRPHHPTISLEEAGDLADAAGGLEMPALQAELKKHTAKKSTPENKSAVEKGASHG